MFCFPFLCAQAPDMVQHYFFTQILKSLSLSLCMCVLYACGNASAFGVPFACNFMKTDRERPLPCLQTPFHFKERKSILFRTENNKNIEKEQTPNRKLQKK